MFSQNLPVPWKSLLTSGPFWAILVAHTCNNFGWYMLLVELPTYMKHILRFNISEVNWNLKFVVTKSPIYRFNRMLDSLPFPTCLCGCLASSGVTVWIGRRVKDGSRPPLFVNCQLPSVSIRLFRLAFPLPCHVTHSRCIPCYSRLSPSCALFCRRQFRRMRPPSCRGSHDSRNNVYRRLIINTLI